MTWWVALLVATGSLCLWLVSIAIVVPLLLMWKYGSVELRSKSELREQSLKEDPSNAKYPNLQKWTDANGNQHDVQSTDMRPRGVAITYGLFAPLSIPLLPFLAVGFLAAIIVRWEGDRLNGRLEMRRKVRAAMEKEQAQLNKLMADARKELESL
jgi:hypothetical protein